MDKYLLRLLVLASAATIILCSCSTTRKNKSMFEQRKDSTVQSMQRKDSASIKETSSVQTSTETKRESIRLEFSDELDSCDVASPDSTQPVHTVVINGNRIQSNRRIRSMDIDLTQQSHRSDSTRQIEQFSFTDTSSQITNVSTDTKSKDKEVTRKRTPVLFQVLALLFIVSVCALGFRYFAIWRKRKRSAMPYSSPNDQYPVT